MKCNINIVGSFEKKVFYDVYWSVPKNCDWPKTTRNIFYPFLKLYCKIHNFIQRLK
jgi:hypothetical protein